MAKVNFRQQKKQRELARKQRQDERLQRRGERPAPQSPPEAAAEGTGSPGSRT